MLCVDEVSSCLMVHSSLSFSQLARTKHIKVMTEAKSEEEGWHEVLCLTSPNCLTHLFSFAVEGAFCSYFSRGLTFILCVSTYDFYFHLFIATAQMDSKIYFFSCHFTKLASHCSLCYVWMDK